MENYVFKDALQVPYISSRQNARVSAAAKLNEKKHREASGRFLCEGVKLTLEAALWGRLDEVFIRESEAERYRGAVDTALDCGGKVYVLSASAFDKITTERSPQGIISTALFRDETPDVALKKDGVILLLDCIRDPGNLGTVLRSACALGGVTVATHSCADIYNTKTVRAAMGAIFKADIIDVPDCSEFVRRCRSMGRRVLSAALDENSLKLGSYEVRGDDVVVIGNEGHGISPDIIAASDSTVMIPMEENTESLNASVAASVILWEYARMNKK